MAWLESHKLYLKFEADGCACGTRCHISTKTTGRMEESDSGCTWIECTHCLKDSCKIG
jgi:hypothetical protein